MCLRRRSDKLANFQYDDQGLKLTESFEGLRLTSYQDVVGIWTIGYGHTGHDVVPGLTITQAQAEVLLKTDLAAAVSCVHHAVTYQIDQAQFDALVDFVFNVGRANFLKSTLLKDINNGDLSAAADQFMVWVNAGGKRFDGLVRRRTGERAMFLHQ